MTSGLIKKESLVSESASNLDKMAERIRALLAKADATQNQFPEEAATYREKAEELQRRYQIAEEDLIAVDPASVKPIVKKIIITSRETEFSAEHHSLWYWTAEHTGVRYGARYVREGIQVIAVGYESDIRYAEGLYQSAWLMMSSRLEPTVDPRESDLENVYRLRSSGMARNRVAQLLWDSPMGKDGHADHAKVGKMYAMACAERGEDPAVAGKGINKEVFRARYAEAFVTRYVNRLRASRDAVDSIAGLPALHGRKERVDEAFWAEFPDEHPDRVKERREAYKKAAAEEDATAVAKPSRWTKADQARYDRNHNSAAAYAGQSAGRAAADEVELERGTKKAQRVEPGKAPASNGIALGN
jgi:hypothetical protein